MTARRQARPNRPPLQRPSSTHPRRAAAGPAQNCPRRARPRISWPVLSTCSDRLTENGQTGHNGPPLTTARGPTDNGQGAH
eukprot:4461010-Pyramimonas_sp.AAC.1